MTVAKATMADWLALHGVTAQACRALLTNEEPTAGKCPDSDWPNDPVALWRQVADLLAPAFPADDGLIERTWVGTRTDFSGQTRARAFTLHDDGTGRPLVVFRPKGRLSDLPTLAHEFGHAAQLLASAGQPMPPVLREVCACLSERLALRGLATTDPESAGMAQRWVAGRGLRHRQGLLLALDRPQAVYSYDWNYPLARVVVRGLDGLGAADLARLFAGRIPLATLIT
jgi:hypothetical protein